MSRRKSAAELKLVGSDKIHTVRWRKQNRERELKLGDASGPLSTEPPPWMNAKQKETYLEILDRSHKGSLCHADGPIVEIVATLLYDFRRTRGQLDDKSMSKLYAGIDRLGMTPVSRGKIASLPQKEDNSENPLNEFGT